MAIIRTTIGTRSNENVNISSVADSGPWTVTLSGAPSADTVIGDTLSDEAASPNTYLITGISGADLTVRDAFGAGVAPSAAASSQAFTARTYADINAADADLDDTGIYSTGDVAELALCEKITITAMQLIDGGATVALSEIRLLGHEDYRHDGTVYATGWIDYVSNTDPSALIRWNTAINGDIGWLGITNLPAVGTIHKSTSIHIFHASPTVTIHHCILKSADYAASTGGSELAGIWCQSVGPTVHVSNCVVYGFSNSTTGHGEGIKLGFAGGTVKNCTVYDCLTYGISTLISSVTLTNNVVMGGGTADLSGTWNASSNNNYTSDTTAPGGLSLVSQTDTDTFTNAATYDLHLKAAANARTQGANLEGAGDDIETDIDGETRPSTPTAWDIGADMYSGAPLAGIPVDANFDIIYQG